MARLGRLNRLVLRLLEWPLVVWARLTREGWFFLGLVSLCALFSLGTGHWSNIPLLLSLMLLSLWMVTLWQGSRALRRIRFRRSHLERTFANEAVTVTVYLDNASRLPSAGVMVVERIETAPPPSSGETDGPPKTPERIARPPLMVAQGVSFITALSGHGEERARYTVVLRRRGIYRFGTSTLETAFPLGFFQTTSPRIVPGRLVVYPRLGEVDTSFLKDMELALRHVRASRPTRAEEDCRGLREYRAGDSPKWIHWRSSARLQRLLVREFEEPEAKRVLLLLDTNLQRLGAQRFAANEQAISFAGTLARELVRRGYEIECVALQPAGRVVRALVDRERRNLDLLFEILAGLRRDDSRTLAALSEHIPRHRLHHAFVLVVGLGSLRGRVALNWLNTLDNEVKILDARGEEFRRIFHPLRSSSAREEFTEEDLLLDIAGEDAAEMERVLA